MKQINYLNKKLNIFYSIFILLFFLSCNKTEEIVQSQQTNCLPTNLQNGVIALYSFGNGSLNDSSGNNYHLTNPTSAMPGIDRSGNSNCAFRFNETNLDYLEYSNPTFLDNLTDTNLSISFWYKSNENIQGAFISRDNQPYCNSTFGSWSVGFVNVGLHFATNNGFELTNIVTNVWKHIVVTSNSSGTQMYVDGVLNPNANGQTCQILNQGNLYIGRKYDGLIDDIVIYNRILTQSEVTELYNLPACCE